MEIHAPQDDVNGTHNCPHYVITEHGMLQHQAFKGITMDGDNFAVSYGTQARGVSGSIDKAHLSRDVSGVKDMEDHVFSTLIALDHTELAGNDDVQGVVDLPVFEEVLIVDELSIVRNFSETAAVFLTQMFSNRRIFDVCLYGSFHNFA
jgi:hypothetical protein